MISRLHGAKAAELHVARFCCEMLRSAVCLQRAAGVMLTHGSNKLYTCGTDTQRTEVTGSEWQGEGRILFPFGSLIITLLSITLCFAWLPGLTGKAGRKCTEPQPEGTRPEGRQNIPALAHLAALQGRPTSKATRKRAGNHLLLGHRLCANCHKLILKNGSTMESRANCSGASWRVTPDK